MEFNPQHWAYTFGRDVRAGEDREPSAEEFGMDCWNAKALEHYRLGRVGFVPLDQIHRVSMQRH